MRTLQIMAMAVVLFVGVDAQAQHFRTTYKNHAAFQNRTLYNIRQRYVGRSYVSHRHRFPRYRYGYRGFGYRGFRGFGYRGVGLTVGYGYYGSYFGVGSPWCGPGYSYFAAYDNPYGIYYNSAIGYPQYFLPPIYAPAELAYGPQNMNRFLGVHLAEQQRVNLAVKQQAAAAQLNALEGLVQPAVERKPQRVSNQQSRDLAQHYIGLGDNLFQQQRYHEALQRFKTAAQAAPDLAEPFFLQGHALTATHRYDLAADAFKRAIALSQGDLARNGFQLNSIYVDNQIAKNGHMEDLARAALNHPLDGDLVFLVGMFLYYDGQPDRADKFFERAASLSKLGDQNHLAAFLDAQ